MTRRDFLKLIGADQSGGEVLPVACLLKTGYGCAGFFMMQLNTGLDETVVLVNAKFMVVRDDIAEERGQGVRDFSEFLEKTVAQYYKASDSAVLPAGPAAMDAKSKTIPLAAIRLDEISVLYPIAAISKMMRILQTPGVGQDAMGQKSANAAAKPKDVKLSPGIAAKLGAMEGSVDIRDLRAAVSAQDKQKRDTRPTAGKTTPPAKVTEEDDQTPSFLDFNNKSVVVQVLRTKLW